MATAYPPIPPRDDLLALFRAAQANAHGDLGHEQRQEAKLTLAQLLPGQRRQRMGTRPALVACEKPGVI